MLHACEQHNTRLRRKRLTACNRKCGRIVRVCRGTLQVESLLSRKSVTIMDTLNNIKVG